MARILVVEDDPAIALGLEDDLTLEGYEVEVAEDGAVGMARARDDGFDLVLLDVMLPKKDGFEVCRELRRGGCSIPIIMLTAKTQDAEKVLGLEIGADDYVTKPFSLRELMARIRAQLRRLDSAEAPSDTAPPMAASEPVQLGAVTVDLAGHRLRRDGRDLPVKPKAFELLAFLLHHPGQVFSRDHLLERVWGYDYAGETRTVDVHVHWLRSAIEVNPGAPRYLQTVRGVGYVLRS